MRNEVNRRLTFLKPIQNYKKLNSETLLVQQKTKIKLFRKPQLHVTDNYKKLMKHLSQYYEYVMGPPRCKFAVVGMGSRARNEITPQSDFKHILLLEMFLKTFEFIFNFLFFNYLSKIAS